MDFRYIMPVIISVPIMLSGFLNASFAGGKFKAYKCILIINVIVFLFSSMTFYMLCV